MSVFDRPYAQKSIVRREAAMLRDVEITAKMSEAIQRLEELNISYRQPTVHQLKVGLYNFYPSTGTIVLDGGTRHPSKGLEVFVELVQKIRHLRSRPSSASNTRPSEVAQPQGAFHIVDWDPKS